LQLADVCCSTVALHLLETFYGWTLCCRAFLRNNSARPDERHRARVYRGAEDEEEATPKIARSVPKGSRAPSVKRRGFRRSSSRAKRSARHSPPRLATVNQSADSKLSPTTDGLPRGSRAPRRSTRSTRRASLGTTHLTRIKEEAQALIARVFEPEPGGAAKARHSLMTMRE